MNIKAHGTKLSFICDGCNQPIEDLNLAYFVRESRIALEDTFLCHQHHKCPRIVEEKFKTLAKEAGHDPEKVFLHWSAFHSFVYTLLRLVPTKKEPQLF